MSEAPDHRPGAPHCDVVEPAYADLEPRELWRHFAALNRIPRPSGAEERATAYVHRVAQSLGVDARSDAVGNTVVYLSARGADDDQPAVAVQAHLDMVCERTPETEHDFATDPIVPRRDGSLIYGTGTTLGADNGIGAAAALAVLTTPGLRHGPLELLFTVDEERGLRGAQALDPSLLSTRTLINLDGDSPSRLTIGSSGMNEILVRLPANTETETDSEHDACSIALTGLRGGHSGQNIGERRANALKLLAESLLRIADQTDCRVTKLEGGTSRNSIPREAKAELLIPAGTAGSVDALVASEAQRLRAQWSEAEPELRLTASPAPVPSTLLSTQAGSALLALLERLPHGAFALLDNPSSTVKTSANLARVEIDGDSARITLAVRSFEEDEVRALRARIAQTAAEFGAEEELTAGYPAWPIQRSQGDLIATASAVYESLHQHPPGIDVVHAGLECGIIAAKLGGAQAVCFGPLIRDAHTPSEHVDAATVPPMWALLLGLLDRLSN